MRSWFTILAGCLVGLAAGPAVAGMCQTPFMHDGGRVQLSGSGMMTLGADLSFSNVKKQGDNACQARVQGTATYGLAGLPGGKSKVDYWMKVSNGQASFERDDGNGQRVPVQGKFDLRMLGLFSYASPITQAGQTFPAQQFQLHVDKKAVDAKPVVIRTGERTVGERQRISTAAGEQSCWPVQYTRVSEPTQASFNGLVLPVPGMTSAVTDWYCPDVSMVMKQDSVQSGVTSTVEVTLVQ
ncbi:hypothetical protein [Allopusillimonas ginsengisoli]|uniref:hypothetical protein n=1 Tax=Allopusillimonas ginsengisoli TaxID=453575 RepID=UPI001020EAFE|nr:hypothetical protein [Allopusillimonas ginsengisoli]TEA80121.1 hypothetical protein ERE07_04130 [Allopusillimonas ginsengisoli]